MREGEQADAVMVILDGRAKVCLDEDGWERVMTERGPGDLIGENAHGAGPRAFRDHDRTGHGAGTGHEE